MSAGKCVILVPVNGSPVPECDDRLRALEKRGYEVWRVRGYSAIDAAQKNRITSDELARGPTRPGEAPGGSEVRR